MCDFDDLIWWLANIGSRESSFEHHVCNEIYLIRIFIGFPCPLFEEMGRFLFNIDLKCTCMCLVHVCHNLYMLVTCTAVNFIDGNELFQLYYLIKTGIFLKFAKAILICLKYLSL